MWGPFCDDITEVERIARLRALRALAGVFTPSRLNLITALRQAENDPSWLEDARVEIDRMPALLRRRVLSAYQRLARPQ